MSKTTIAYKDVAPGAAEDAEYTSGSATPFSDLNLSEARVVPPIITGEQNELGLDGTFTTLGDTVVPFWSVEMSGPDCVFANPPSFEVAFDNQHTSVGISFYFGQMAGSYCRKLNVKWYQQSTLKADVDFYPNGTFYHCQYNVESYNRIVVTLLETNLPYKYAKIDQVMFGVERVFGMTEIRSAKITNQMNLVSTEVPVSTLNFVLDSLENIDFIFQLKQQMEVVNDGRLIGVYYINQHSRSAQSLYSIRCQDAFGVLDGDSFSGGVYFDYSAKQLLEDIVGGDFDIFYDTDVTDTMLTGYIAPQKRRSAIQQVAFAWGVCVATDGSNGIRVFHPGTLPSEIGRNRTYTGATVTTAAIVTEVRVTAHSYEVNDTGGIEFNGVRYKDTTSIYSVFNPNVTANDKQNVIQVPNATLVSPAIAQSAAQRVYDYYLLRDTAKAKIVWNGELLGDCVTLPNAWNETNTGSLSKMDMVLSNVVAANSEVRA